LTRTNRPWLQFVRSVLLLASTLCNFAALRYLQLDEAIALIFSTPFFVAALSGPMLGEWVRWRRWTAIAVGFLGVLVVTRPGAGGLPPGGAAVALRRALLRALFHHHAHPRTYRFQ
jgi:drug/metabolite transporter (DMT)-like permease